MSVFRDKSEHFHRTVSNPLLPRNCYLEDPTVQNSCTHFTVLQRAQHYPFLQTNYQQHLPYIFSDKVCKYLPTDPKTLNFEANALTNARFALLVCRFRRVIISAVLDLLASRGTFAQATQTLTPPILGVKTGGVSIFLNTIPKFGNG